MDSKNQANFKYGIAAFMSSMIAQITHPLDIIKTRLQSHDGKSTKNLVPKYSGIADAFKNIAKKEGLIKGFGKGFFITIFGASYANAVFFYFYENSKQYLQQQTEISEKKRILAASIYSSFIATIAVQPFWVIRTRVYLNTNNKISVRHSIIIIIIEGYERLRIITKQIITQHGFRGLYRGITMSFLLCSHGIIQMNTYEYLQKQMNKQSFKYTSINPFFCGFLAKAHAIYSTYPLTTIRTRIQQNQYLKKLNEPKYKSIIDIAIKTFKNEGVRGFYKGVTANLIRSVPSKGVFFFFYEYFKKLVE